MVKMKIAVVDSKYLGDAACFDKEEAAVKSFGGELHLFNLKNEEEIIEKASFADALLCCGNPPITEKVLQNFSGKAIIRYGIGVNSVDLDAATRLGKIVYNSPGFCSEELTMHASALILASLRNVGFYNQNAKAGIWAKGQGPKPRRLSNLTVGLFGFGDSARHLADVFVKGFRSRVLACDPYLTAEVAQEHGAEMVDFDTLVRESDVLSIHAPLTAETKHIFNRDVFHKMKNDALLVNIARGGLVCEADLVQALQEGEIGSAALDVLENEPINKDNPLIKMDNVIITPHSGFYGREAIEAGHEIAAMLISNLANGRVVKRNVANKKVIDQLGVYELI